VTYFAECAKAHFQLPTGETSDNHKKAMAAKSTSQPMTAYFSSSSNPSANDLDLAAREGVFAYHTVAHNHSFRSIDCTSKLVKELYDKKFTCSRTKCEAIAVNVLSPFIFEEIRKDLDEAKFVTLSLDSSNHASTKLLPIQVQYFSAQSGMKRKMLELHSVPGETSEILTGRLLKTAQDFHLESKIIAIGADNTNTNFGGVRRMGKNNVFYKFKEKLGRNLLGIGCSAHIVHNAMEVAAYNLPVAVEAMIVKIYNYFHIYTVRTEELKEFCSFVNIEYKKLLGSSNTRWLSLGPAIERMLEIYSGVRSYFLSQSKCPKQFSTFFEDPKNEVYLTFLFSQAKMFNECIQKMEKDSVCAAEVGNLLTSIVDNLKLRRAENFIGSSTRKLLRKLVSEGDIQEKTFLQHTDSFFDTAIEYLENWTKDFDKIRFLDWTLLKKPIKWEDLESAMENGKQYGLVLEETKLFDEYSCLNSFLTAEKMEDLQSCAKIDEKWQKVFVHFDTNDIALPLVKEIVEFSLCLPGTNASVERCFSIMNDVWSSEKMQLSVETLKAVATLKNNACICCREFYNKLRNNPSVLTKIHSSQKYT